MTAVACSSAEADELLAREGPFLTDSLVLAFEQALQSRTPESLWTEGRRAATRVEGRR